MLNPCKPRICPGAPCEQCHFGYLTAEVQHKILKDMILNVEFGRSSYGRSAVELYEKYHTNWREELGDELRTNEEVKTMNIKRTMTITLSKEEVQQIIKERLKQEGFIVDDKDISFDVATRERGTQRDSWTETVFEKCTVICKGFENDSELHKD